MVPGYVILDEFDIPGRFVDIVRDSRGFINDTSVVTFRHLGCDTRYVLQRVNHNVFRYPEDVMENLRIISSHCRTRDPSCRMAEIVPTRSSHDFFRDEDGNVWRLLTYIENAVSYDRVLNPAHAEQCGRVLGRFLDLVSDIEPSSLKTTIPGYHLPSNYLHLYDEAPKREAPLDLVEFIEKRRAAALEVEEAEAKGIISRRIVHGDPRVNNIMLDEHTGEGVAMIDLDTAGPGLVQMDVGDAVRSICNPAGEDVQIVEDVAFRADVYAAFMKGFYREADHFLTEEDRFYISKAIRILPFELGLRFFTDHLNGDRYFKVSSHGQNLRRAMGQFRLCKMIEEKEL